MSQTCAAPGCSQPLPPPKSRQGRARLYCSLKCKGNVAYALSRTRERAHKTSRPIGPRERDQILAAARGMVTLGNAILAKLGASL